MIILRWDTPTEVASSDLILLFGIDEDINLEWVTLPSEIRQSSDLATNVIADPNMS